MKLSKVSGMIFTSWANFVMPYTCGYVVGAKLGWPVSGFWISGAAAVMIVLGALTVRLEGRNL